MLVIAFAPLASAGTPDAPELTDPAGDCAVPYGNEYLDIVAAWIDGETADALRVNLKLAKWTEPAAEGTGLTVQFTHQGVEWGIIGTFGQALGGGWTYATGKASANAVTEFNETSGSFDASTAVMTITFPKSIFPHADMNDRTLKGIKAISADLRTAYPYFVGARAGAPLDGNGKWTVCDEAVATADYVFGSGHGGAHTTHASNADMTAGANATATPTTAPTGEAPAAIEQQAGGKDAPLAPALVLAALAAVALALRRR